jgi:CHAT domain-containing protein
LRKKDLREMDSISQRLYRLLVEPVKSMMTARRLFIIPHGWLHYIPFQALREKGKYLVEEFSITYAPSVTILRLFYEKARSHQESALILANPRLDAHYAGLHDLPFAEDEATSVYNSFKNATMLIGKEATETNLKEKISKYDVLHLASHAFFDRTDPLGSTILLAADDKNDGHLTASEVFQLDTKTWITVLSACETGLSYVSRGDELIGFTRAFLYSGTLSILSTLWPVDDKSTAYLMEKFYSAVKTFPKDIALQKAQIETMNLFPHPYNWSPFTLVGSPQ